MGGIYGEICTKKGIYQRKWRLCGIILHGVLPLQGIRPDLYGQKGYLKRRQADIEKNEYCRNKGIPLLRIRFDQAYLIPNMIDDFLKNSEKYSQQFNTYLADDVYYSICQ